MSTLEPTTWSRGAMATHTAGSDLVTPLDELYAHHHRGMDSIEARARSPISMPVMVLAVLLMAALLWAVIQRMG